MLNCVQYNNHKAHHSTPGNSIFKLCTKTILLQRLINNLKSCPLVILLLKCKVCARLDKTILSVSLPI